MIKLNSYVLEYIYKKIGSDCIDITQLNINSDNPILENLNTYSADLLSKKIKENWPNIEIANPSQNVHSKSTIRHRLSVKNIFNDNDKEKFKHLIEFFGYHISKNDNGWLLIVPVKSDDATEYCRKNYFQFYHFTKKSSLQSILKNGIRCRGKENTYRTFPSRVYLYSTLSNINEEILQFAKEVVGVSSINDISVLKVKVPMQSHIKFYHDDGMPEGAVFCYCNIPSKWCKEVSI